MSGATARGSGRCPVRRPERPVEGRKAAAGGQLVSAKVVQDNGDFYERRTLPRQMREAITQLHRDHNCRIFVISLGDVRARNEPGRVGPWAATLDELARELDVLIFVSAGNRAPRGGSSVEQAITEYPAYLLEAANRLCEPAGASNVITVGHWPMGPVSEQGMNEMPIFCRSLRHSSLLLLPLRTRRGRYPQTRFR
ncbi:S8 family serine peptidase (plasmid) [Paracoccus marcusii]|uniref:S8 family serine peptidase n=1 Tax=Paracoccus marcusii TaxID=59779 RepID=UPI002ED671E3|nr:S8 family serine peptidase [Paracoccus marcusii]